LADQADDFKMVHLVASAKSARSPLSDGACRRGLGWSERDGHLRCGCDGKRIGAAAGAFSSRGAILGEAIGQHGGCWIFGPRNRRWPPGTVRRHRTVIRQGV
jgi:hypothetical protein